LGARFGDSATVLLGSEASERALKALNGPYEVVHLATEGALNRANPLFSYLRLDSTGLEDGRLEVHEVAGLDLRARLVTLSACETALGSGALADVPAGDDWLGFVRAFLYAGASDVLATLWRIDDQATADFMSQFYEMVEAGMRPAEALAATQRLFLSEPSTRQPFYWAGFVLSGS
jgi:CHAT domain-containing protein